MTEFISKFNGDEKKFRQYVKEVKAYNAELEKIYFACIAMIQKKFIGKKIGQAFQNRMEETYPSACIEITNHTYDNYKIMRVGLSANYYEVKQVLLTCVSFHYANPYQAAAASLSNEFIEGSVDEIINTINANRKRIARLEDAQKNLKKQTKMVQKAIQNFIDTMNHVNPIFADDTYFYCYRGVGQRKYEIYEEIMYANVDYVTPENVKSMLQNEEK